MVRIPSTECLTSWFDTILLPRSPSGRTLLTKLNRGIKVWTTEVGWMKPHHSYPIVNGKPGLTYFNLIYSS